MLAAFPDGDLDQAAELGAVDDRGLRLWVRSSATAAIDAELSVAGHSPVRGRLALSAETDWTGVLPLTLPSSAPGAPFTCTVGDRRLAGRLAPAPLDHASVEFGFGSCHRPYVVTPAGGLARSPAAALYPAMAADLRQHRAAFLLLVGDQIYSDELAPINVRTGLTSDATHPPSFADALREYRRVSRGFLGETGFRRLREAFPTYCIWDDHEIISCWGSRRTKTAEDRQLFAAASRAYCEYQHVRNPGGRLGPPPYHYSFRYGDVGFLVLDLRGDRDYASHCLMGPEQWQAIAAYLASAEAATLGTLFVVASVPVAHVSRWLAQLFDRIPGHDGNSVRDHWSTPAFLASRDALLEALLSWQGQGERRQVIILSGDVHCASAFTMRPRTGTGRIEQFTSSALTTADPLTERMINRLAVQGTNLLEPRFAFRRHLLTFRNNFGRVSVAALPDGGHRVTFRVRAWHPRRHRLETVGRVVTVPGTPVVRGHGAGR